MAVPAKEKEQAVQIHYLHKRSTVSTVLMTIILWLSGGYLMVFEKEVWTLFGFIVAFTVLAVGAVEVIAFFRAEKDYCPKSILVCGILDIVCGVTILFASGMTGLVFMVPYAIGGWAAISGVVRIGSCAAFRRGHDPAWGWVLMAGLFYLLFAGAVFCFPMLRMLVIIRSCAAFFIITGMLQIGQLKSKEHYKKNKKRK